MAKPVSLSDVVGVVRKKLAPSVSAGMVMAIWRTAVGSKLALHCKPVNWKGGELKIICDSSVWASALMSTETAIIEKIQKLTGSKVVSGLQVQVRVTKPDKKNPHVKRKLYAITPEIIAESEDLVNLLPYELRSSFQKAYISQKKYRRTKPRD